MKLTVTRICRNAAGQEIRADYVIMTPKRDLRIGSLKFLEASSPPVTYRRTVKTTIYDFVSDGTVASIDLIGTYTARDETGERDWCTWTIPTDIVESGTRETKTVRCNMSDLPSVGDSTL